MYNRFAVRNHLRPTPRPYGKIFLLTAALVGIEIIVWRTCDSGTFARMQFAKRDLPRIEATFVTPQIALIDSGRGKLAKN